jgi:hypothetical protein
VRTITLRSDVAPTLRGPSTAYAGYPFFVTARAAGAPDGTKAVVQRRAGAGLRPAGTGTALRGEAEAVVVLPRGDQQLRVVLSIGAQQLVSPARHVTVRRARRWSTRASDDGRYTGRAGSRSVRLRVAKPGRELRGFSASVAMLCPASPPASSRPRSPPPPWHASASRPTAASWRSPPRARIPRSRSAHGCATARCPAGACGSQSGHAAATPRSAPPAWAEPPAWAGPRAWAEPPRELSRERDR